VTRPPDRSIALAYAAVALQTVISAGTFLLARRALDELPPLGLAMVRFVCASACFVVILAATRGPLLPERRHWKRLLVLAVLGVPANQAFFMSGLARSTPTHAALLYTLTPAVVLVLASLSGGERVGLRKMAGLLLAALGAATVVLVRADGAALQADTRVGDLLILCAVVAWGAYTAYGKPVVGEVGAIAASSWTLVAGTVLFVPIGVPAALAIDWSVVSATALWALAYLVVFTSVVAYLCWYFALKHLEPSRVAIFTNLQPVATAGLSAVFLGESISWPLVVGGLLVIAGVLITTSTRIDLEARST